MSNVKSIEELIALKSDIAKSKEELGEYYVASLDSVFKFKKATRIEQVKIRQMEECDIDSYNVFSHVVEPNLKDPKLLEVYGEVGRPPYYMVDNLLTPKEVGELSLAIIGLLKDDKDIIDEIKN